MKILVTGGSGFIGTNLVAALQQRGHAVLNFDPSTPRNPDLRSCWREGDLCRIAELRAAVHDFRPETIYHLGARTDLRGRVVGDYAANTTGVSNLLDVVSEVGGIERIFFASSRLVCRIGYEPQCEVDYCASTPYGESKIAGEKIVRSAEYKGAWCIFRPTSIWGPWFGVPYKDFFLSVAKGRYVHPRGRKIRKSFGYVGNSVDQLCALLSASEAIYHRKTFYLADPPLDVESWARLISAELGRRPPREVPMALLQAAAVLGDLAKFCGYKEPPLTRFRLDNLLTDMVYDTRLIEEIAGPPRHGLTAGVRETVAWLKLAGEI